MRCSSTALVLATLTVGQAAAGTLRHAHLHQKQHAQPADLEVKATQEKREPQYEHVNWATVSYTYSSNQQWSAQPTETPAVQNLKVAEPNTASATSAATPAASSSPTDSVPVSNHGSGNIVSDLVEASVSKLASIGFKFTKGSNPDSDTGLGMWIGNASAWTNEFTNESSEDVTLVCWNEQSGYLSSFMNAAQPAITITLAQGSSTVISFKEGTNGACTAIYSDTAMNQYGQVDNTWLEFTMSPPGVINVSREVNMNGHTISSKSPAGCVSDMETCVFKCSNGASTCTDNYVLDNCDSSLGQGQTSGTDSNGGDSGGCGWNNANGAAVSTTFH